MSDKSSIEWLNGGATWNPIRARNKETGQVGWFCIHASEGCRNCYAGQRNKGFFQMGTRLDYKAQNQQKVDIFIDEKVLEKPLRWKRPRLIFPCSMTDLFGNFHTDEQIGRVFDVMYRAEHHTFIVLTKQAERMYDCITRSVFPSNHPLQNLWLLVSVENQHWADIRIPWVLKTPAAVRGVSYEPALGPVVFDQQGFHLDHASATRGYFPDLDWIVVGGESGPGARPFDIKWARDTIAQCKAAGVPVFVKQLGSRPTTDHRTRPAGENSYWPTVLKDKKGGDPDEWPQDLRVREYPDSPEPTRAG